MKGMPLSISLYLTSELKELYISFNHVLMAQHIFIKDPGHKQV